MTNKLKEKNKFSTKKNPSPKTLIIHKNLAKKECQEKSITNHRVSFYGKNYNRGSVPTQEGVKLQMSYNNPYI